MKITKQNQPLVSIVMPVYNAEKYLAQAIGSVLQQTYRSYELVIIDDCSTDSSWNIIQKFQKRYPKKIEARQLKTNTNAAGNAAVNIVFPSLKGKYIARMDADDIAEPARIEKQVAFLEKNRDVILVGSQAHIINEAGEKIGNKIFPVTSETIYNEYFTFHPILHPSVMIHKSLLPQKKYLYENLYGINDDYYTFFKLLQYGKFANINEQLLHYRMHKTNTSLQKPKKKFITSLIIRFEAVRRFHYRPTIKALFLIPIQTLIVFLLPEKYIVPFYFLIRGITSPRDVFKKMFKRIQLKFPAIADTMQMVSIRAKRRSVS